MNPEPAQRVQTSGIGRPAPEWSVRMNMPRTANKPKLHHYVPALHLAGFTESGTKDDVLYVLDTKTGKRWQGTPRSIARQRDLYTVDLGPSYDPLFLENQLATKLEDKWGPVLRTIFEQQRLPRDEPLADLISFVAFQAVRVPSIREVISRFVDRVEKSRLRAMLATGDGREQVKEVIAAAAETLSAGQRTRWEKLVGDDPELEGIAAFAIQGDYVVKYDQTWHVQTMARMAVKLFCILAQRNWALWIAEKDAPNLVCSDRPVCVTGVSLAKGWPAGFGCANTLLTVPLNRRMLLASTFEKLPDHRVIGRPEVLWINARTVMYATQVYSADGDPRG